MSSNTAAKTPANTTTKTRMMVQIAMLTAVAEVLMLFDFPLPFAPSFYKIDLSEVPSHRLFCDGTGAGHHH